MATNKAAPILMTREGYGFHNGNEESSNNLEDSLGVDEEMVEGKRRTAHGEGESCARSRALVVMKSVVDIAKQALSDGIKCVEICHDESDKLVEQMNAVAEGFHEEIQQAENHKTRLMSKFQNMDKGLMEFRQQMIEITPHRKRQHKEHEGLNRTQEGTEQQTGKRQKDSCDGQRSPALTNSTEHSTELDTDEENDDRGRPVGFSSISASPILPPGTHMSDKTPHTDTSDTSGDGSSEKIDNPLCTTDVSSDSLHRAPLRPFIGNIM